MLKKRNKKNLIIGLLCTLLLFMGTGYAVMMQKLTVSGTAKVKGVWDVHISSIDVTSKKGMAKNNGTSFDNLKATFSSEMFAPGDYIEYSVTVKNAGNIDAILKSVVLTDTNKESSILTYNNFESDTVLKPETSKSFTIWFKFDENATTIPKDNKLEYNLNLIYEQHDGSEVVKSAVLKVGDYVRYKSTKTGEYQGIDSSTSFTTRTTESGLGWDSGIARDIDTNYWRVLSIEGDKVTLISASASNPTARATTGEDSWGRLILKGEQLYNNGVEILNSMCDFLYTTEFGNARSINIEDLNKLAGYTPASPTKRTITNLSNAYYPNRFRDDYGSAIDTDTQNTNGYKPSVSGINKSDSNISNNYVSKVSNEERYAYVGASVATKSLTFYDNSYSYTVTADANGELITDLVFGDDRTSTKGASTYWIATRSIHYNGAQAWFTMFYSLPTSNQITYDGYPYASDNYGITTSSTKANQRAHFLRPIVELKSNVKINTKLIDQDDNGTIQNGTKEEPWTISW